MKSDLGCACLFMDYSGDEAEFYDERYPKARKEYFCCECSGTIHIGEVYEKVTGKWDGAISTYKTCKTCAKIRKDYFCTWTYGCMREDLMDHFGIDYVTGESAYDDDEETP